MLFTLSRYATGEVAGLLNETAFYSVVTLYPIDRELVPGKGQVPIFFLELGYVGSVLR